MSESGKRSHQRRGSEDSICIYSSFFFFDIATKFFECTVHILSYGSIVKVDAGAASFNGGWLNTYTWGHYFKDA